MKKNEKSFRMTPLLKSLCVILLYFIWPYLINGIGGALHLEGNVFRYFGLIADFLLLLLIIMVYTPNLKKDIQNLQTGLKEKFIKGLKIFAIGFTLYLICNSLLLIILPDLENNNMNNLLSVFEGSKFLLFIMMVFYYPIVEEFVFKKTFRDVIENKWAFILITGLINAFFEVCLSATALLDIVNIIPTFIFYSTISYIYYETDNIFISTIFRVMYNLIPGIGVLVSTGMILNLIK